MNRALQRWSALVLGILVLTLAGCTDRTPAPGQVTDRASTAMTGGVRVWHLTVRESSSGREVTIRVRRAVYEGCRRGDRWPECRGGAR